MKAGDFMRTPMDEATFLEFYKNTLLCGSNNFQRFICKKLELDNKITFEEQRKLSDSDETLFFESKKDFKGIITKTATSRAFSSFYEEMEYKKLYKYSVPFFYETGERTIEDILKEKQISIFDGKTYEPDLVIDRVLSEAIPRAFREDKKYFIKFVLQKAYLHSETFEQINYRYPVVIYIDPLINVLEIRYDSMRYSYNEQVDKDAYSKIVMYCVEWIKDTLGLKLFACEHTETIRIINIFRIQKYECINK